MITMRVEPKHLCSNPEWFRETRGCEIGSLWQCDECGREQMLISKDGAGEYSFNRWRYTVEVVDKRVQQQRVRIQIQK
jgi:hypothetical protein